MSFCGSYISWLPCLTYYFNVTEQYDAQIVALNFAQGITGKTAMVFKERSRFAIASYGPLGQGEPISLSLFFKTSNTGEMILVAYGSQYTPFFEIDLYGNNGEVDQLQKDLLLLTIKDGLPILYTSNEKYVIPEGIQRLNDDVWHHIAITMPKKSCLLSEVNMYIDGRKKTTSVHGNDQHIFFYTTGSLSLGGWGYSHEAHEALFSNVTHYEGTMDDFRLWSRKINRRDLKMATKKNFEKNLDVSCIDDGSDSKWYVGREKAKKCGVICKKTPSCSGYELEPSLDEKKPLCYFHHKRPTLGDSFEGAQCNPIVG
jgi:hypothetical protein